MGERISYGPSRVPGLSAMGEIYRLDLEESTGGNVRF